MMLNGLRIKLLYFGSFICYKNKRFDKLIKFGYSIVAPYACLMVHCPQLNTNNNQRPTKYKKG